MIDASSNANLGDMFKIPHHIQKVKQLPDFKEGHLINKYKIATIALLGASSVLAITAVAVSVLFASFLLAIACGIFASIFIVTTIVASRISLSQDLTEKIIELSSKNVYLHRLTGIQERKNPPISQIVNSGRPDPKPNFTEAEFPKSPIVPISYPPSQTQPKLTKFTLTPEMEAAGITQELLENSSKTMDLIVKRRFSKEWAAQEKRKADLAAPLANHNIPLPNPLPPALSFSEKKLNHEVAPDILPPPPDTTQWLTKKAMLERIEREEAEKISKTILECLQVNQTPIEPIALPLPPPPPTSVKLPVTSNRNPQKNSSGKTQSIDDLKPNSNQLLNGKKNLKSVKDRPIVEKKTDEKDSTLLFAIANTLMKRRHDLEPDEQEKDCGSTDDWAD